MPKVTFTYSLPEEQEEYNLMLQATTNDAIVRTFGEYIRRKYKHAEYPSDEAYKEYEEIRQAFFDMCTSEQ